MYLNKQKTIKISMEKFLDYSIKISECVDQINDIKGNFENCLKICHSRSMINFYYDELDII